MLVLCFLLEVIKPDITHTNVLLVLSLLLFELLFLKFCATLNCFQPIKEGALGNIPTIAFCDTDSPMRYVDIGIPANNKGKHSIGCLFWILARMVLQMRGVINQGPRWEVMVRKENSLFLLLFIDTIDCMLFAKDYYLILAIF